MSCKLTPHHNKIRTSTNKIASRGEKIELIELGEGAELNEIAAGAEIHKLESDTV